MKLVRFSSLVLFGLFLVLSSYSETPKTPTIHAVLISGQAGGTTTPCTVGCTGLQVTWTAPSNPGVINCQGTASTNCIQGQSLVISYLDILLGQVNLATVPLNTTATSYTWNSGSVLKYGSYNVSITALGVGGTTTTQISSAAAAGTLSYSLTTLNPPTGLSATPIP